ncbi:hypothetical protein K474DRAFT_1340429 [Panus rudis PR-1116 ss-1]|nr:hypothetical protein K474DRAFT_1340429 [Panus rudis PR-1116 ss-1]
MPFCVSAAELFSACDASQILLFTTLSRQILRYPSTRLPHKTPYLYYLPSASWRGRKKGNRKKVKPLSQFLDSRKKECSVYRFNTWSVHRVHWFIGLSPQLDGRFKLFDSS